MGRYLVFEPSRHAHEARHIRLAFRMCTCRGELLDGYEVHHATVLSDSGDSLGLAFDQLRAVPGAAWADVPIGELTFFDDALELSEDDCRLSLTDPVSEVCGLGTHDGPNHFLRHIRVVHEASAPALFRSISSAAEFGMQEHIESGCSSYLPQARFGLYESNSLHPADVPAVLSRSMWSDVYGPLAQRISESNVWACRRLITRMRDRICVHIGKARSARAKSDKCSSDRWGGCHHIEQATAVCLAVATNDADFCLADDGGEGAEAVFASIDELVKCSLAGFTEGVWEAWDIQSAVLFLPQLICAITECNNAYAEYMPAGCLETVVDQARAVFLHAVLIDRTRPQASALQLVPPELLRLALGGPALVPDLGTRGRVATPGMVWLHPTRFVRGPA